MLCRRWANSSDPWARRGAQQSRDHAEQADARQRARPRHTIDVGGARQGDERQHPAQEARPVQRELRLVGLGQPGCVVVGQQDQDGPGRGQDDSRKQSAGAASRSRRRGTALTTAAPGRCDCEW